MADKLDDDAVVSYTCIGALTFQSKTVVVPFPTCTPISFNQNTLYMHACSILISQFFKVRVQSLYS